MAITDASLVALRVFRAVAERGSFTAAAVALGYTQSAVSRQIAALERAVGADLLERRHDGVRVTAAGRIVLRRAVAVAEQIEAAAHELAGLPGPDGAVRLGWFTSAGAGLVPRALADLRRTHPGVTVTTREAATPALIRALRAGSLDLAVIATTTPLGPPDAGMPGQGIGPPDAGTPGQRHGLPDAGTRRRRHGLPDAGMPPLRTRVLTDRSLMVAVPANHPLAGGSAIDVAQLRGQEWIAGHSSGDERLMGVWPGLDERPVIAHVARDWLAKLHLVAAGCGLTTIPPVLAGTVPDGVRVLPVRGGSDEGRQMMLAWLHQPLPPAAARLAEALQAAAGVLE
ncbi:LysR family transcriptional regulator [Actinoplanes awajinensis]|uniref:LysR family transcriptional regulator n=1 Tax=Actinoplanes awajinensis subsp. mycoplanecinus TaxID=135947 RepID=A0A0X3V6L2_9ACTN|nr:LysR family transcriptional regulator [Actinoplanes awajinensis]KUL40443.1 LysR family transcriptional regulator [Actinoplanes awajinensis subsp. mycoplanecinus]